MADRTISVRLRAEVNDFKRAMAEAGTSTDKLSSKIDKNGQKITTATGRMVRSAEINRDAWTKAGTSLTAFGLAGAAALGLSVRAAVQWESAWTGVLKTVDGTDAQLQQLQTDLRGMALEVSASSTEIAAVAEAAGQLGVQVGNVAAFTRVMIDLGVSTNLTAQDAATSLARMANIFGTTEDGVARMGSTIVDLGNNSATTESEIVALATRLSAAGKIAGLSEADVFAFASTLSSVGVDAEAGGTALSKVFTSISDAARDGGEKLQTFADVSGVSVDQFRKSFEKDAAGTIAQFIDGMGRLSDAGGSTTAVFDTLQLTDQRLMRAILSTSSAQGLLNDQLDLANQAWKDNTALVEEAAKRYDTTEAKIQIAKNAINDAAIEIGDSLLPALASMAEGLAKAAEGFANLPGPVKSAATGIGGLVTAATLLGGGFLLLVPRLIEGYKAMRLIAQDAGPAAVGLGKVGKAAGVAAVAFVGLQIISDITDKLGELPDKGAGQTAKALLDIADGAKTANQAFSDLLDQGTFGDRLQVKDIEEAWKVLKDPSVGQNLSNIYESVGSLGRKTSVVRSQSEQLFATIDQGLAALVQSGGAEQAAAAIEKMGIPIKYQADLLPGYTDSLAAAASTQKLAATSATDAATATDTLAESEQAATDAANAAAQAQQAWVDSVMSADAGFISGQTVWDEAIQKNKDLAQATADATKKSTDSWETYFDGKSVSKKDFISGLEDQVKAQQDWEKNILAIQGKVNNSLPNFQQAQGNEFVNSLFGQGVAGADQTKLIAGLSDKDFQHVVDLWSNAGTASTTAFANQLDAAQPEVKPAVDTSLMTQQIAAWAANLQHPVIAPMLGGGSPFVRKFARGGIADTPIYQWAEDGREALVPLDKPLSQIDPSVRSLAAFAKGIPSYANGGVYAPSGGGTSVVTVPVTSTHESLAHYHFGNVVTSDIDSFTREMALNRRRRSMGGRR